MHAFKIKKHNAPLFDIIESAKTITISKRKDVIVNSIVTFLLKTIQSLLVKISELEDKVELLSEKNNKPNLFSPKYKRFSVDEPPVVREIEMLDYKELIKEYKRTFGKELKPINR